MKRILVYTSCFGNTADESTGLIRDPKTGLRYNKWTSIMMNSLTGCDVDCLVIRDQKTNILTKNPRVKQWILPKSHSMFTISGGNDRFYGRYTKYILPEYKDYFNYNVVCWADSDIIFTRGNELFEYIGKEIGNRILISSGRRDPLETTPLACLDSNDQMCAGFVAYTPKLSDFFISEVKPNLILRTQRKYIDQPILLNVLRFYENRASVLGVRYIQTRKVRIPGMAIHYGGSRSKRFFFDTASKMGLN